MNVLPSALRTTGGIVALAVALSVPVVQHADGARPTPASTSASLSLASATAPQANLRLLVAGSSLRALPTSGSAWSTLRAAADGSMGKVDLADQDNVNAGRVLAAALAYARTGQGAYRTKVVGQLAKVPHASLRDARVLSVGRQLGGYAIAADVVGYRDPGFVRFMSGIRTRYIGNHGRWTRLAATSADTGNNWGAWAMASRVSIDAYLGDKHDLAKASRIFHGFLGYRAAYAGFHRTSDYDRSWGCGRYYRPINPSWCGAKSGAVVEDISRSAHHYPRADDTGRTYTWETLGGATLTARVLAGHGYPRVWKWSHRALLRAARFQQRHGGYRPLYSVNQYIPWAINRAYGVHLGPVSPTAGFGRQFGFTDWLS